MSQRRPPPPSTSRRDLFRAMAALPAASWMVGCRGAADDDSTSAGTDSVPDTGSLDTGWSEVPRNPRPTEAWGGVAPVDGDRFPLGCQTGDPLPNGFVAWSYAPGASRVTVHLARWQDGAWVDDGTQEGTPSDAGYVHLELTDLLPDTTYAVQAVLDDGAGSTVAQATTAPAPDAAVEVRFGGTSCLDQGHGEFPSLDELQTLGPLDAMLWLGDTVYGDGRRTVESDRELWQELFSKATLQRLFASTPGVFTWDDHEVDNNWNPQTLSLIHI